MTSSPNLSETQPLSEAGRKIVQTFASLGVDEKLALLYYIYTKMGGSITPAEPDAADPDLAPVLLGDFYNLSNDEQLNVMRDIVDHKDTDYSHAYGALKENNQLMVWFAWAQAMGDTVVDLPSGYQASAAVSQALSQIESLDFEEQMSVLREVAGNMGYTSVKPAQTQVETGKTSSL